MGENQRRGRARHGLAEHRCGGVPTDRGRVRQAAAAVPRAVEIRGASLRAPGRRGKTSGRADRLGAHRGNSRSIRSAAASRRRPTAACSASRSIGASRAISSSRSTICRRAACSSIRLKRCPSPTAEGVVNAARFLTDATGKGDQTGGFARAIAAVNGDRQDTVRSARHLPDRHDQDSQGFRPGHLPGRGCLIRIKTSPRGENRHAPGIWIDESRGLRSPAAAASITRPTRTSPSQATATTI